MSSRRRGFTLAELVLSLAITTVIGLAVTGVSAAVSKMNQRAEAYYEFLQCGRIASSKLQQTLRPALLVTAASTDKMVIWENDSYDSGYINASEVAEVYVDSTTSELKMLTTEFPTTLSSKTRLALDSRLLLSNVTSTTSLNLGSGHSTYDVRQVLARNVKSFEVYTDTPAPLTKLLKFKLVTGDGEQEVTEYGSVALRAPQTSKVSVSKGVYVLN